jgi:hypothetical protein
MIFISRPELIKVGAFLGVAQGFIGLLDLLELLRVTAFVRVVFSREFPIGLFDILW